MRKSWLILLGCLAGCGVGTVSTGPVTPLPADWKNAGGFPLASPSKDLSRWWQRFDDPVLTRLIRDGLSNSPDVVSATSRVREARARRDEAASILFPSIQGSAGSSRRIVDADGARTVDTTVYSAGLTASWEADLFGRNRSNLQAAAAGLGAAEENLHSVQAALAAEIAAAYANLRADEARLEVLGRIVSTREQTAQLAGWRQQAGETDSLEPNQAQTSLESARAGVPALQQAIGQTQNLLARLCGQAPGQLDATLAARKGKIPVPERRLAVGIPADTVRQRPDVRVAGYQLLAAAANTRAAKAEQFPSLRLTGSLGVDALKAAKIFNPSTVSSGLIAGLTGPVFDAGRIRANIEATAAVEEQVIQNYRATVLTALSEVEDALIACRRTAERLATLEKATATAREADKLAQQKYQAGETDLLTVLESQRSLLGLEDGLLGARSDLTTSYIRLYQALGGGWGG